REKAQLADGYRNRGDRLIKDLANVRGLPQEKDQLQRAREDYKRALELYQDAAPWGNASAWIARVQKNIDYLNQQLQRLDQPIMPSSTDNHSATSFLLPLLRRLRLWR